jgi:hypothetical protein
MRPPYRVELWTQGNSQISPLERTFNPGLRFALAPTKTALFPARGKPSEYELANRDRKDHDHQEDYEENEEQDLRDLRCASGNARVAQCSRDERYQETNQCPFQESHVSSFNFGATSHSLTAFALKGTVREIIRSFGDHPRRPPARC